MDQKSKTIRSCIVPSQNAHCALVVIGYLMPYRTPCPRTICRTKDKVQHSVDCQAADGVVFEELENKAWKTDKLGGA